MLRLLFVSLFCFELAISLMVDECDDIPTNQTINSSILKYMAKASELNLHKKHKGQAGKIGVIGGSVEYTGAPFFAAISALKAGADLVYVITTEDAAPVIKSYSPDLIVYPYLDYKHINTINSLLTKMNLVIIGPGLGRNNDTMYLTTEIIKSCKELHKPLVIDADGLYAVSKNPMVLKDYLRPGVILTPNIKEMERLKNVIGVDDASGLVRYFGRYVNILEKGETDKFTCAYIQNNWNLNLGGSNRRVGGQGDILAGLLGTFFNWAIAADLCENELSDNLAASTASYIAAKMTRYCNYKSFLLLRRSFLASDMLNNIHVAYDVISYDYDPKLLRYI